MLISLRCTLWKIFVSLQTVCFYTFPKKFCFSMFKSLHSVCSVVFTLCKIPMIASLSSGECKLFVSPSWSFQMFTTLSSLFTNSLYFVFLILQYISSFHGIICKMNTSLPSHLCKNNCFATFLSLHMVSCLHFTR